MGHIFSVEPKNILITEWELDTQSLEHLVRCVVDGSFSDLAPAVVRFSLEKRYVLDGHHRLCVADMLDVSYHAYVPSSSSNFMEERRFPHLALDDLKMANFHIDLKFDRAPMDNHVCVQRGLSTIRDLRQKYGYLESLETAKKYFGI